MLNQIKRNAQTKPILNMIAKQIMARPDIPNIYVTPAGFKSLLNALPEKIQKQIKDEIDCDKFVIKIYKG